RVDVGILELVDRAGVRREKVAREGPTHRPVLDARAVIDVLVLPLEIVEPGVGRMRRRASRLRGRRRRKRDDTYDRSARRGEAGQEGAANDGVLCGGAHDGLD